MSGLDKKNNVVGKLGLFDILMALEPRYGELNAAGVLSSSGHSPELIRSMLKDNFLWSEPLQFICSRATQINVSAFMEALTDGVYIKEDATLDEAMHQLIVGRYDSLLVTRDEQVVGILRLSDVFTKICDKIKTCER